MRPLALAAAEHVAPNAPDDTLVDAAMADPEVFAALYTRYMPRLYRYLYARLGSPEDAADLTQQAFARAFHARASYRPSEGPFVAWLFKIARNGAIDARRRARPSLPIDTLPEAAAGVEARGPEEAILERERLERLQQALAGLDPRKRDLLALRYAAGLSIPEIAALTRKSEAAVKKQLYRTLLMLKEHYRDELD